MQKHCVLAGAVNEKPAEGLLVEAGNCSSPAPRGTMSVINDGLVGLNTPFGTGIYVCSIPPSEVMSQAWVYTPNPFTCCLHLRWEEWRLTCIFQMLNNFMQKKKENISMPTVEKTKVTGSNCGRGLNWTAEEKKPTTLPDDKDELITEIDCLEVLEPESLKVFWEQLDKCWQRYSWSCPWADRWTLSPHGLFPRPQLCNSIAAPSHTRAVWQSRELPFLHQMLLPLQLNHPGFDQDLLSLLTPSDLLTPKVTFRQQANMICCSYPLEGLCSQSQAWSICMVKAKIFPSCCSRVCQL